MPSSRTVLVVLVAVVFAGCVGGPLGAGGPSSPADPPGESPTPTPTVCTEPQVTPVDPVRESVEPSTYPDRPATWNESSVRSYVVAFEKAWSRNRQLRDQTKRVTVSVTEVSVTETAGGYRVRLTSQTNTWYGGPAEGNETATIAHGDGALVPVAYALTDGRLVRAEGGYEATPTVGPRSGRTVRCFE